MHLPIQTIQNHLVWNLQQTSNWSVEYSRYRIVFFDVPQSKRCFYHSKRTEKCRVRRILFVEELFISPSLISLLTGTLSTDIETSLLTGKIAAQVEQKMPIESLLKLLEAIWICHYYL